MQDGTERLLGAVAALADADLDGPSAAARAGTAATCSRTSPRTPTRCATSCTGPARARSAACTPQPEQRDADIAAGARRPAPSCVPGSTSSAAALAGRPRRAAGTSLGREGHHRAGTHPVGRRDPVDARPRGLRTRRRPGLRHRLRRPARRLPRRPARRRDGPPLGGRSAPVPRSWSAPPTPARGGRSRARGAPAAVSAPLRRLAAWLTGRPTSASASASAALRDAPALPPWL